MKKKEFNPLVSIIIPVYNGANYMREAIDSALTQTYKNIEVIVVNDGSADNTDEIARSYGDKIRYFKKENGGVSSALNLALREMRGEYFSWLSHDDIYYPNKVEKQIDELFKLPSEVLNKTIIYSNFSFINEKSELISVCNFEKNHDLDKLKHSLYPLFNGLINGCTLLIPRKCFCDNYFFDEKLKATQDYDLWFRMFPWCQLIFMGDILVKSRLHGEQGSKKIDSRQEEMDDLWMKAFGGVSNEDKIKMSGNVLKFYKDSYDYVKNSKRSVIVEKYLYKKIKDILSSAKFRENLIIANMATYPAREKCLKKMISSVLPQVDILNIYLNCYEEIPTFLNDPRINCVLSKDAQGDLRDNGKFYFVDKVPENCYYFTIDDDIIYPDDYVNKMIGKLRFYDNNVVIGVHGVIFHKAFIDFTKSRTTIHFQEKLSKEIKLSVLGTGTVLFYLPRFKKLKIDFFRTCGMSDLWFASYCKENKIDLICIERNDKWLRSIEQDENLSLWGEAGKSSEFQNKIINKHKLWELPYESIEFHRVILEEQNLRKDEVIINQLKLLRQLEKNNLKIKQPKFLQLKNLFLRSMRNPYKIITFPINFFKILFYKNK